MAQSSLQQKNPPTVRYVGRIQLLNKIESTHNVILEFDPATGQLKGWA